MGTRRVSSPFKAINLSASRDLSLISTNQKKKGQSGKGAQEGKILHNLTLNCLRPLFVAECHGPSTPVPL